jgi:hypothetical protein
MDFAKANDFGDVNPRTVVYRAKPTSSGDHKNSEIPPSSVASERAAHTRAAHTAKRQRQDREKAQNVCRTVVLGVCAFFFIVVVAYLRQTASRKSFDPMQMFGFTTSYEEDEKKRQPHVVHTTHLKADLHVLKTMPFQQRMFHRDLNVQNGGEADQAEEFVYGRPVPGMHSKPLPHREIIHQTEVLWQIPPPPMRIKYLGLLFHGCGRRAMSFYYSPEGISMVQQLLDSNYAVASFSKMDDEQGCWRLDTPINQDNEIERIATVIKTWIERLHDIPDWQKRTSHVPPIVHGFGASSGGHLVAALATDPSYGLNDIIHAIHVQVAAPNIKPIALWSSTPTFFTIMARDWNTKSAVKRLKVNVFDPLNIPCKVFETKSKKITNNFFRSRVPGVSKSLSGAMRRELLSSNVITTNGELLTDPRNLDHGIGPLKVFVHGGKRKPPQVSDDLFRILTVDELSRSQVVWIAEELNVAWNAHEITCDKFDIVLKFLKEQDDWVALSN